MSNQTRLFNWAIVALALSAGAVTVSPDAIAQGSAPPAGRGPSAGLPIRDPVDYRGDGYDRGPEQLDADMERMAEARKADREQLIGSILGVWPKYKTEIIIAGIAILAFFVYLFRN